ncbi:MAG TPA: acetamidase/formamidase family protein [Chloroflexota bacterium]|jgi:amidase|nr:acetamidase/formamidase family protein [Chloroflexota bacterium]
MHRVRRDQLVYAFDRAVPPVVEMQSGESVVVETYDASTGRLRAPEDLATYLAVRDRRKVNPAGGPIFVRGARTGDELVVTIERITLADQGYVRAAPGGAVLADVDGPRAIIVKVEGDPSASLRAGPSAGSGPATLVYPNGLRLPARPMVGVIGTAPAQGVVYTGDPGPQGSNLDCNAIRVGATVHLPVAVEGALLCIGDVHASMGDGEVSGTGVEINAEVQVKVESLFCGSHGWPWIESDDEVITTGHGPNVQDAINQAVDRLVRLLGERHGLSRTDAFMVISARGDVHVGQCCGGLDATAYASFPKLSS